MERDSNVIDTPALVAAPVIETPDLSAEIIRTVKKQPGDLVKCRRVAGDTYRCNWFAPEQVSEDQPLRFLDSYRIRESRFLRVRKIDGQLVIEDLTLATVKNN